METGPTGVAGANVVKHVNKESNQETENARHQLLSMVENHAMASQAKSVFATRMYLVQVKILWYMYCKIHKLIMRYRVDWYFSRR